MIPIKGKEDVNVMVKTVYPTERDEQAAASMGIALKGFLNDLDALNMPEIQALFDAYNIFFIKNENGEIAGHNIDFKK